MPLMTRIADDLKAFDLAPEAVPGWQTRGVPYFAPAGVTCHWTAGPRGTMRRASLGIVTDGRAGLPGPLCNVYLDRAGIPILVAAGRANHAGSGGWRGLVGNSAVYGIEAESGGDGDWTAAQRASYPVVVAALLHGLGRGAEWAHGHNEWAPTRKIDIRDWPMARMRNEVAEVLAAFGNRTSEPREDEDMALHYIIAAEGVDGKWHQYFANMRAGYVRYIHDQAMRESLIAANSNAGDAVHYYKSAQYGDERVSDTTGFGVYVGPEDKRPKSSRRGDSFTGAR